MYADELYLPLCVFLLILLFKVLSISIVPLVFAKSSDCSTLSRREISVSRAVLDPFA